MAPMIFMDIDTLHHTYNPTNNTTKNVLNKYERAKVLGMRMEQLARSAPAYVSSDPDKEYRPYDIATKELKEGKLPYWIVRQLPNGNVEYWKVSDMVVFS